MCGQYFIVGSSAMMLSSKGVGEPIYIPHIAQAGHPEGGW
tara:strand:- start:111 stop:230 length:120 start_codon:yes stop_codon:yes gene_type:complete